MKVHAPHPTMPPGFGWTLCGIGGNVGPQVTCGSCLRILAARPELQDLGPICEPIGERSTEEIDRRRDIGRAGRRALRGEVIRRARWETAEDAVRSLVSSLDEGASLRSTLGGRAIRVQVNRNPGLGGREHDAIEQHATVRRALEGAIDLVIGEVPGARCLEIYVWRVVGKPVTKQVIGRRGSWLERVAQTEVEIMDLVDEHFGIQLGRGHIRLIRRHFTREVENALLESGELGRSSIRKRKPRSFAERTAQRFAGDGDA